MIWNEGLNIESPKFWIKPEAVITLLPPYYRGIVRNYVGWMQEPHSSLEDLPWEETLIRTYRPLNPVVREIEEVSPTTRFVYEGIYSFFAGLVTGVNQPQNLLDSEKAGFIKRRIWVNLAEIMQVIYELGTRKMSFDQKHNVREGSYKLHSPKPEYKCGKTYITTITRKDYPLILASFEPRTGSFQLEYGESANLEAPPAIINGVRTSHMAEIRIERSRSGEGNRRLMVDFEVRKLLWEERSDGRCLPKPGAQEMLIDQYFGEKRHHINLATFRVGGPPTQGNIDTIIQRVMTELGLSRLLTYGQD